MRNCPVCGESFGDELNFCDVDGAQLERDPADLAQEKNKLWSILGVALLVGALVISALSIIFLPKGRVSSPALVSSQPQPAPPPETKLATTETSSSAEPSSIRSEPETPPSPDVATELKKKEAPVHENANLSKSAKAAAQSAEEAEKPVPAPQPPIPAPVAPKKPETPSAKAVGDKRETETSHATPPAADAKSAGTKPADNANSKKKSDDKDKKKGGFFKVFKKIFGKD